MKTNKFPIREDNFCHYIEALERQQRKDISIAETLGECFPNCYVANLLYDNSIIVDAYIKVLEEITQDEGKWITYFCYDLDFGKENYRLKVYDKNGDVIPLKTAKDLYNLLKDNYEKDK